MKRQLLIISLSILCEVSSLAQNIVWNWVPNPQANNPGAVYSDPIGVAIYPNPINDIVSIPIDMTGNGTVDFEFQAVGGGPVSIEVLPSGSNAVLSIPYPPPDLGQEAVALNSANQVSSLTPVGTAWLQRLDVPPYPIGSDVIAGIPGLFLIGQFIDQRGYVGVEFYATDGLHYGALDVAGSSDANLIGILYGYGYNPVPGAPFNLSDIPRMPVPEPSTRALLSLGSLCVWMLRLKH